MTIEGLEHLEKDGWELARVGRIDSGEYFVNSSGMATQWDGTRSTCKNFLIIRKKPKQYRPCENMAEAMPFWDRKLKEKRGDVGAFRVVAMGDASVGIGFGVYTYREAFEKYECDDGTPFGVEVQ